MAELEDLGGQLLRDLARLRERSSPPMGAEQRVRVALDAAIGSDPGGGEDGGSAGDDGGPGDGGLGSGGLGSGGLGSGGKLVLVSNVSKLVAATLAITCVGLLVHVGATPHQPATSVETPRVEVAGTPPSDAPASTVQPDPEPEPPIVVTLEAKPIPVQRTSEPDEEHLSAEVTLLEQARATDDRSARLELLEQHRARFENGYLVAERESLRIATLCELDQLDTARRAAEEFLRVHPRSPLRLRMRSACPELDILAD